MARKPSGTYVRNTPDWFIYNAAAGIGGNSGIGDNFGVGLYNNATDGSSLYVYGIGAQSSDGEVIPFNFFQGPLYQFFDNSGGPGTFPIDPLQGQLPGQIYIGLTATQQTTPAVINEIGLYWQSNNNEGNISAFSSLFPGYPLAIVRPGFSFACWAYSGGLVAHFYYVVLSR